MVERSIEVLELENANLRAELVARDKLITQLRDQLSRTGPTGRTAYEIALKSNGFA